MQDTIQMVPLDLIEPARDNVRKNVGDVAELAASIKAVGLLEPLVATNGGAKYQLVIGHRRLAAAKKAGLKEVPVIVRELDERARTEAMLIENLQREDLTPLEEADAFRRLLDIGLTQRELGERIGRSQSHVSKRLALLELPANVRKALDSGGITIEDGVELAKLKDHPNRLGSAFSRRGQYNGSIARLVEAELEEIRCQKKLETRKAELKEAGTRVVVMKRRESYYAPELPSGAVAISARGGWNELKLDPETHASEPCHAIALNPWHPDDERPVCTDRKRHPKATTDSERTQGRGRNVSAKRKEHDSAMRVANKARKEFARQLVAKPPAADVSLEQIVRSLVHEVWQDARKAACEILGLDHTQHEQRELADIGFIDKWEAALLAELDKRGGVPRVAMAIKVGRQELAISRSYGGRSRDYYTFLEARGYEISPAEKLEIAGKAPR